MIEFRLKYFSQLTPEELYEVLSLRQEVFIVEQNCPYLDTDGKDYHCLHLMGFSESGRLIAYTRLIPRGISYENYASIGRVVSSPKARGTGAGRLLMQESIRQLYAQFGHCDIKIGAQSYLLRFYESFGFQSTGKEYLEDGIPHTEMLLAWSGN